MKGNLMLVMMFLTMNLSGQNSTEDAQLVVAEGKLLYKSEMASWYGTDLFLENYKNRSNIGGYFSYTGDSVSTCVFFSSADAPRIIGTISFDSTFNIKTAKSDMTERDFTPYENDIYVIRRIALLEANSDTLFKTYQHTNMNFVPLINGSEKKVYILTGPQQNGVVIFGNDYLLTFDRNNKLLSKKQLHRNIIPVYYGKEEEGTQVEGAVHNHSSETGDFMTATDICTLMLYGKFAKWKTHHVISEKYLNIWNCETDRLTVIPKDAVDRIDRDQEKRHRKKQR